MNFPQGEDEPPDSSDRWVRQLFVELFNALTWPGDTGNAEVNVVSITKQCLQKCALGSEVRVKKGVTAPNRSDIPMGGWHGKVYDVSGTICLVHWSEATLEAIHLIRRERQQDGEDFRVMWLQANQLEADLGEPY